MVPLLEPDQLVAMFVTLRVDEDRKLEMPFAHTHAVPGDRIPLSEAIVRRETFQMDTFRDLVQVSFLAGTQMRHFMNCELAEPLTISGPHALNRFDSEEALIHAVGDYLVEMFPTAPSGDAALYRILVGWRMHTDIWPSLLSRFIKYGANVPRQMISDPMRKWFSVTGLVDLASLYLQGANPHQRALPSLAETLRFWGCLRASWPLPSEEAMANLVCDAPHAAAALIEPCLLDIQDAVLRYYRLGAGAIIAPVVAERVGLAVPPSTHD